MSEIDKDSTINDMIKLKQSYTDKNRAISCSPI